MNSFNRLLYTYRSIINRKIIYNYNRNNAQNFMFSKKNSYIYNTEKKQ